MQQVTDKEVQAFAQVTRIQCLEESRLGPCAEALAARLDTTQLSKVPVQESDRCNRNDIDISCNCNDNKVVSTATILRAMPRAHSQTR